jgi:hypothetical protein
MSTTSKTLDLEGDGWKCSGRTRVARLLDRGGVCGIEGMMDGGARDEHALQDFLVEVVCVQIKCKKW